VAEARPALVATLATAAALAAASLAYVYAIELSGSATVAAALGGGLLAAWAARGGRVARPLVIGGATLGLLALLAPFEPAGWLGALHRHQPGDLVVLAASIALLAATLLARDDDGRRARGGLVALALVAWTLTLRVPIALVALAGVALVATRGRELPAPGLGAARRFLPAVALVAFVPVALTSGGRDEGPPSGTQRELAEAARDHRAWHRALHHARAWLDAGEQPEQALLLTLEALVHLGERAAAQELLARIEREHPRVLPDARVLLNDPGGAR
jgi:hypothetical protein